MTSVLEFFGHFFRHSPPDQILTVELEREDNGRFIAELPDVPGVMAYGASKEEALQKVMALAFRVLADRLESDEVQAKPDMTFQLRTRESMADR